MVTFEISRSQFLAPEKTDGYKIPDAQEARSATCAVTWCPARRSRAATRRSASWPRRSGPTRKKAWEHVEAIYDWVREHVKYDEAASSRGALAALKDGNGECEDMTSLFIAICRAAGIPARTVWVPGHCYPEFYLVDDKGEGHWFPCQAAGPRAFGCIPETKPILQKGDNFRPPNSKPKDRQRYLAEFIKCTPLNPGGDPKVTFIREAVQ